MTLNASRQVTVSASTLTVGGVVGGNTFTLTKLGDGTLKLNNANTYGPASGTLGTTIKAGTLTAGNNTALGMGDVTVGNTTGSSAATLNTSGNTLANNITIASGSSGAKTLGTVGSASSSFSGAVTLNDTLTIDSGTASGTVTLSGAITGNFGVTKVGTSTGAASLSKASSGNTYTGNTTISQGTLQVGSATAIPNGSGKGIVTLNPTSPDTAFFDLNGQNQTINSLTSSGTGTAIVTNSSTSAKTLTIGTSGSNPDGTFAGAIQNNGSGILSLTKAGSGTLTLSGANTYTGNTTISAGTLALGSSGSINNSASLSISAGATFDVSAISAYALSASTTLTAAGTGTTVGTSAAAIKGAVSGTVSLGSQAITLTYDGSHPALYVSQGTLALNGNAFTVNKASALAVGTYTIIQQASGNITSAGTYTVNGTAIGSGKTATISVSGGNVILTILNTTTTTVTRTVGASPSTYGNSLTFHAVVNPSPANGSTVTFKTNGVAFGTATTTSGAADLVISALNYSGGAAYTVTADFAGDASNAASSGTLAGGQQVDRATLTYTATATNRIYGAANPAFTGTITGFVLSENQASATTGTLAFSTTATTASVVGSYAINGSGLAAGNYIFTQAAGNASALTITQASLTITASNDTKIYGQSKTYGAGSTAFTSSGLANGETIGSVTITASGGSATNAPAGNYTLTPSAATGGTFNSGNYNINYQSGTLTVTPAVITVTANSTNRIYGAANPTFLASYSGFVNGETASVISGSPLLATSADTNSVVGNYVITAAAGSLSATNYSFNLVNGTLTVNQAALGVTANNDSKTYNGVGYTGGNGVVYSGFVNGETSAVLGGTLSYGGTAQGVINAGTYSITPSGLTSDNYAISYTNGTLTINPLTIAVTAAAKSKTYGDVDPALTYSFTPGVDWQ